MTPDFNLLICVNEVCATYAASVTSWWRSPSRNMKVGGVPNSAHLHGGAFDVVYDGSVEPPSLQQVMKIASKYRCKVLRERDHDHFQVT